MKTRKQIRKIQLETRYNFARQVRLLREGMGFSLKEFAQESHIPEKIIQQLELGKIENIGTIFALAQFFNKKGGSLPGNLLNIYGI